MVVDRARAVREQAGLEKTSDTGKKPCKNGRENLPVRYSQVQEEK